MKRETVIWTIVMLLGALALVSRVAFTEMGMGREYVRAVAAPAGGAPIRYEPSNYAEYRRATAANQANGAVAIGNNNKAIGQGSVALGNSSTAGASGFVGNIALGNGATSANPGVIRKRPKPRKRGSHAGAGTASGDAVTAPMQGTVVKVAVEEGQEVSTGDLVVVLEAMKMENPVTAHKDGTITGLAVEAGAAITQGTVLAEIK